MALLELRRRGSTFLFIVVVVTQIVVISTQVTSKSGVPLLQAVTFGLVAQVQRAGAAVMSGFGSIWGGYIDLRGLRAENETLKSELGATQVRLQRERALAQRSDELGRLLGLKMRTPLETAAAEVIAGSATPDFRTVTLGKGSSSGFRPDMAVIAPNGVVGRVIVPSTNASKVQLLIDRNAAAGAMVERSRAQGVVFGDGGPILRLDFVNGSTDVKVGDTIVTSGIDGIYPKGFVIGQVAHVDRSGGSFRNIQLRPAVDFSNLEDVLVILTPVIPEPAPPAIQAIPEPVSPPAPDPNPAPPEGGTR